MDRELVFKAKEGETQAAFYRRFFRELGSNGMVPAGRSFGKAVPYGAGPGETTIVSLIFAPRQMVDANIDREQILNGNSFSAPIPSRMLEEIVLYENIDTPWGLQDDLIISRIVETQKNLELENAYRTLGDALQDDSIAGWLSSSTCH